VQLPRRGQAFGGELERARCAASHAASIAASSWAVRAWLMTGGTLVALASCRTVAAGAAELGILVEDAAARLLNADLMPAWS